MTRQEELLAGLVSYQPQDREDLKQILFSGNTNVSGPI